VRLFTATIAPQEGTREVLHIVEDLTERLDIEQQLRQSQKMEVIGQLTGGIAHDFNNLLTIILGNLDIAQERLGPDTDAAENVQAAIKGAMRGADLTQRLLAFARKQALQPRLVNINDLMTGTVGMLKRMLGETIKVSVMLDQELWSTMVDPSQVEDAVLNLAVNARDAMAAGGTLSIETREVVLDERPGCRSGLPAGRYARLTVRDTGVGMSRETLARIFEPFFTTKTAGTGLGLATVHGIVEQSGGNVTAYSEAGQGTVFKVDLPVVEEAESAAAALATGGAETVLLVEDEAGVRAVARKTLRMKGYHVLEADGGRAALDLAATFGGPIDLLLTDVVMPGMAGTELAAQLAGIRPAVRVLYMSGYTDDEVFRAAAPLGGTAFIEKPFTPDRLARAVRATLDGGPVPSAPAEELA
jgi:nitrogen-specific signal transduction histidine kinase